MKRKAKKKKRNSGKQVQGRTEERKRAFYGVEFIRLDFISFSPFGSKKKQKHTPFLFLILYMSK